jgi:hypothetical protein
MSNSDADDSPAQIEAAEVETQTGGRFQIGVRELVVLVGCCGLVVWAWRVVRQNLDLDAANAGALRATALRGLESSKAGDRVVALRDLAELRFGDRGPTIRMLIAKLWDADAKVRAAAADGLGVMGAVSPRAGIRVVDSRAAINALLGSLKDRDPQVRTAAARTLGTIDASSLAAGVFDLKSVVAALTGMLGDPDSEVRQAAIRALGATRIRDSPAPRVVESGPERGGPIGCGESTNQSQNIRMKRPR